MRERKRELYSRSKNTVKRTLAFLLVFAMMLSAISMTGIGSIVARAEQKAITFYYYFMGDCQVGFSTWKWERTQPVNATWIGKIDNNDYYEFSAVPGKEGWYQIQLQYDPGQGTNDNDGFQVALIEDKDSTKQLVSNSVIKFGPWDDSNKELFAKFLEMDDPAYREVNGVGEMVSYATISQEEEGGGSSGQPTKTKADIQALMDTVPKDYTTDGIYETTSVGELRSAMSNAATHIESGADAQNEEIYKALQNALNNLRYYDKDIVVEKVEGLGDDFIKGVDVSSYITLVNSGVVFYNYEGQPIDSTGFFKLFADAGVNYVRIRIWNDPKNAAGEYYGGGNNDVQTAVAICNQIQQYNTTYNDQMKVLIDFHYSDFWVDPDKQEAPKAWKSMSLADKTAALKTFTKDSLATIAATGIDIGMVQIGNETNNGICGETGIDTAGAGMCAIFQAGCEAVNEYNEENGTNILKVVHFTDPHKQDNAVYNATALQKNGVEYDVYATSYYPYWHGTTKELSEVLKKVATATGKKVMVAETQEIYTNKDADGFDNQAYEGKSNIDTSAYSVSVQGQANEFRDVIAAVASVGKDGIGMFYWEPAWLPVGYAYHEDGTKNDAVYAQNQELWKSKGSGWASPAAEEFDESVKQWGYGGTNCENAALFDFYGHPLASLNVFKYVNYGAAGAEESYYGSKFDVTSVTAKVGMSVSQLQALLPEKTTATTNYGAKQECAVVWDEAVLQKIASEIATNMAAGNSYTATGTVAFGTQSYTVSMQIEVVPAENRLVNGDFEAGNTGWEFGNYTYALEAPTNSKGNVSCEVNTYNITEPVPFTTSVKQTVSITEPGYYSLIGFAEGNAGMGSSDAGENISLKVTDAQGNQYNSNNLVLEGWMIWQKASIEKIKITKQMIDAGTNTLEVEWVLTLNADRWGTLDDTYLFKTEALPDSSDSTTTPGTTTPGTTTPGTTTPGTTTPGYVVPGYTTPGTTAPGNTSSDNKPSVDQPSVDEPSQPQPVTYKLEPKADGSLQIVASDGTVVSNQLFTLEDGNTYYADENGTVAVQKIVQVDTVKYFAKEDGVIAKNEFCTTAKGNTVYAAADGALAVNRVVNVDGKKYYAKSSCAIAKNGFCITAKGNKVYAQPSGELMVNKAFQVAGSKYFAKPSGALARNGFYTADSGRKVYAKASGKLVVNQIFRVRGKTFYANKYGTVVQNKWVKVGNKRYYCSSAYKITKTAEAN